MMLFAVLSAVSLAAVHAGSAEQVIVGVFMTSQQEHIFRTILDNKTDVSIKTHLISHNITDLTSELCAHENIQFIYAVTTNPIIQLISLVATQRDVPVFVYDVNLISTNLLEFISASPSMLYMNNILWDEGAAFAQLAVTSAWPKVILIVHQAMQYDGLVQSFLSAYADEYQGTTVTLVYKTGETTQSLLINLQQILSAQLSISSAVYDVILLHAPDNVALDILSRAEILLHDRRIVWLASSPTQSTRVDDAHPGIVTLANPSLDQMIAGTLDTILAKFSDVTKETEYLQRNISDCNGIIRQDIYWARTFGKWTYTRNKLPRYQFSVLATSGNHEWVKVANISSDPSSNLDHSIGQVLRDKQRDIYTVVTIPDTPFNTRNHPSYLDGVAYCQTPSVICLDIDNQVIIDNHHHPDVVRTIFKDFEMGTMHKNRSYEVACCEGLAIDVLQSLAADLNFDFNLYISPDGSFGAFDIKTDNWTGMVKELMDGRADMVAASFSITSLRSAVIDFTAPYFYSGFAMLSMERESTETRYFSFTDPFPRAVWGMLMSVAVIAFFSLTILEWVSPYGMNPTHDIDKTSYTLASGIKTVFSLMSGNTLPCKEPKSLPGKFMQTLWGFFSIIILAAYTAELTSSITDNTSRIQVDSIYDPELLNLKVAALANSAGESFIKTINPQLYKQMIKGARITDVTDVVDILRNGTLEVFIHDTPVIDYIVSQQNFDCTLYKMGAVSGDSYGSAFARDKLADLKEAVSAKYTEYQESGYIDKLRKIYFPPSRSCVASIEEPEIQLTVANAAGLFIIVLASMVFGILMLVGEHGIYRFIIPHAKKQPDNSLWKRRGLMFFSQRIHRAIQKKGGRGSGGVFKRFANKIAKSTNFLKALSSKAQQQQESLPKLTFYDVVAKAYEEKHRRPLDALFLKERTAPTGITSPLARQTASAMKDLAMMAAGFNRSAVKNTAERPKSSPKYFDLDKIEKAPISEGTKPDTSGSRPINDIFSLAKELGKSKTSQYGVPSATKMNIPVTTVNALYGNDGDHVKDSGVIRPSLADGNNRLMIPKKRHALRTYSDPSDTIYNCSAPIFPELLSHHMRKPAIRRRKPTTSASCSSQESNKSVVDDEKPRSLKSGEVMLNLNEHIVVERKLSDTLKDLTFDELDRSNVSGCYVNEAFDGANDAMLY